MARRTPDLRKLAKRQRWVIWLFALGMTTNVLSGILVNLPSPGLAWLISYIVTPVLAVVIHILMIIGVVLLLTARGSHVLIVILGGILMVIPWNMNLLVLLHANIRATRTLRQAGFRVGLLGADPEQVERTVDPMLCNGCGYNLTGNFSGYCPECGRSIVQGTM